MSQTPEEFIKGIESKLGDQLDPYDREQIELWRKGRDIGFVVAQAGWQTVLEMLQQYPLEAIKQCLEVKPGDNDRALAAHAIAYALNEFYENFVKDVENCINAAKSTPECLTRVNRGPAPVESIY